MKYDRAPDPEKLKELISETRDENLDLSTHDPKELLSLIVTFGIQGELQDRDTWVSMSLNAINSVIRKYPTVLIETIPMDTRVRNFSNEEDEDMDPSLSLDGSNQLYKWLIQALVKELRTTNQEILRNIKGVITTVLISISTVPVLFRCKLEIKGYLLDLFDFYSTSMVKKSQETKVALNMLSITTSFFYILTDNDLRKRLMLDSSYDLVFESAIRKMDYLMMSLSPDLNPSQKIHIDDIRSNLLRYLLSYLTNDELRTTTRLNFLLEILRDTFTNANVVLPGHKSQIVLASVLLQVFQCCISMNQTGLFVNVLEFKSCKDVILKGKFHNLLLESVTFINQYIENGSPSQDTHLGSPEFDSIIRSIFNKTKAITDESVFKSLLYVSDQYQSVEVSSYKQYIVTIQSKLSVPKTVTRMEQYSIINSIGDLYCIIANSMDLDTRSCEVCCRSSIDYSNIDTKRHRLVELTLMNSFIEHFILNQPKDEDPDDIDVVMEIPKLLTIYKIFSHFQPLRDFKKCPVFKYVVKQFFSRNRDIRLLALRILPLYIKSDENTGDVERDMVISKIFEILSYKDLNDPMNSIYIESVVMGWSLLAVVSDGEVSRPILLKMIDLLASSNKVQSTFAFHELQMIAIARKQTPWQLLGLTIDYWALLIAKQLHNKPLFGQKVSSLVGFHVDDILSLASTHIIPKMVTFYQNDVIGRIANIQGRTKYDLISSNFSKVLAELITTIKNVDERSLVRALRSCAPQYDIELIRTEISINSTVWEILMKYTPHSNKELILNSMTFVLELTNDDVLIGDNPTVAISKFLQLNILALIQSFSDAIRNIKGLQSYSEKIASLNALEFMIEFSTEAIISALPQICTCLQTTLDSETLAEKTLMVWRTLVEYLPEEHLISIINQTVAFIIQKWGSLDWKCREIGRHIINMLFDKSPRFQRKNLYTFYSIADNSELVMIYQKVDNLIKKNNRPILLLRNIDGRCSNNNSVVVKQALIDLKRFMRSYGESIYQSFLKQERYKADVAKIYSTLLNVLHKFKANDDICSQCSKLLGSIGAVDQLPLDSVSGQKSLLILSDFEDRREMVKFVVMLLDKHLVPLFWAAEDPKKQAFIAFAMQQYLTLIDLSNIDVDSLDSRSIPGILWFQLSEISRSTLTPLIKSKFIVRIGVYQPLAYPIFNAAKDHSKWIREFAFDLLKKAKNVPGASIFGLCSTLAKEDDSIASFILPYVSLSLLLNSEPDSEIHQNIYLEISTILSTDINTIHHSATENFKVIVQSVFQLLDYFRKWAYARITRSKKFGGSKEFDMKAKKIESFISKIPNDFMVERSLQSDSHERAIFFLEQRIKENTEELSARSIESLSQTYANIGDFDALNGLSKMFPTKTLDGRITKMEYNENWKMAQDCFEALSVFDISDSVQEPETRLLRSLAEHNLYDQCLEKLELLTSTVAEGGTVKKEWIDIGLQASIFSGKLEAMDYWTKKLELNDSLANGSNLLNYHIGKILLNYQSSDLQGMEQSLENVYLLLAGSLGPNKSKSLSKVNDSLVTLHAVSEVEDILKKNYDSYESFRNLLNSRLESITNEFAPNWNILSLRKTANDLVKLKYTQVDTKDIWLRLTKLARKNNRTDLAASSVMRVVGTGSGELEYAKLLWTQGSHSNAITEIKYLLEDDKNRQKIAKLTAREHAKIQLKYTKWLEQTSSSSSSTIIKEYKSATFIDKSWDKAYFELGSYYSRLLEIRDTEGSLNRNDNNGSLELNIVSHFLRTLNCSTNYLFESMPKVIVTWLMFADNVNKLPPGKISKITAAEIMKERMENLQKILTVLRKFLKVFPCYFWYTVLSQVLSGISKSDSLSSELLVDICSVVVSNFPSQALWSVFAQIRLNNNTAFGKTIYERYIKSSSNSDKTKLFNAAEKLFAQILQVCAFPVNNKKHKLYTSLRTHFNINPDETMPCASLVIPIKRNFDITLPANNYSSSLHNPFPSTSNITWSSIEDRMQVLGSLQSPRHLFIVGSDGLSYGILCKEDELAKDAKIMEITSFMRYHFAKDKEASKRKLNIMTYSVIPMTEKHGVIEWVNNSTTLRNAIMPRYERKGISIDFAKLTSDFSHELSEEKLKLNFISWKQKFSPVFHQWFIDNFPDPSSWYDARDSFTRSMAVMSMVGYILGLGDRHSENILLIESNGSAFHVDFDCIFEKGLTLAIPEVVPFRLTQNLVDAFGITGVEGKFRKSCEVTLGLLRKNDNSVISSLQNYFNTTIDETHTTKKGTKRRTARTDPADTLAVIKRKLRGILEKEGTSVNVEGQVDFLIQSATSDDKLSAMYHGWLSFI
ncbi:hypothetical protein WICPIJ_005008 [Wickerhamomyces pijperi]|uniref:Serine/threonine-protein kinase MEC1 n=1 Tax=Wickerhamomyces pijperi TaxID=599730 RepID=A0A9P8TMS0_WICPI|nr:hypothetical protein WICPIJ_005008 [Wickerhamomyces pijperi]